MSAAEEKRTPKLNLVRDAGANFIRVIEWPSQRELFSMTLPREAQTYLEPAFPQVVDKADAIVLACNSFDALTEVNARMREAMFKAELGLAAAQNDQLEIERWMNRDGETHEECKRRLIAEGRAALKGAA